MSALWLSDRWFCAALHSVSGACTSAHWKLVLQFSSCTLSLFFFFFFCCCCFLFCFSLYLLVHLEDSLFFFFFFFFVVVVCLFFVMHTDWLYTHHTLSYFFDTQNHKGHILSLVARTALLLCSDQFCQKNTIYVTRNLFSIHMGHMFIKFVA